MQDWNSRSDYRDFGNVKKNSDSVLPSNYVHKDFGLKIKESKNQIPWLSRIEYFENNKQNLRSHL